jgi:hypothetical protein
MTIHLPSEHWTVDFQSDQFLLSTMRAALSYADGLIMDRPLLKVIDMERRVIRIKDIEKPHFELLDDDNLMNEA